MTKRRTEIRDYKRCMETLKIQILECTFIAAGGYGEDPDPNHNIHAFIKTLTDYLWTLSEEEREEYFDFLQPGCFSISEIVTLSPSKTGISNHKGIELNFNLVDKEGENIVYVPEWKSKLITLIRNMVDERRMTNIIGDPLIYITSKNGNQILYK